MRFSAADAITRALASGDVGQLTKAREQCRALLKKEPDNPAFLSQMGNIEYRLGHVDLAAKWIKKVLAVKSDSPEIHCVYAEMLATQNKHAEAVTAFRGAISLRPKYAKAYHGLAGVLGKIGDEANAIQAYRDALAIDPIYPEALNNLGVILERKGEKAEAADCFARAIAARPDYPLPLNNLAMIRLSQGMIDEAEELFRRALVLKPDYPDALNNLGMILHDRGNFSESLALYDKALALQPDHPDALNNVGTILLHKGEFDAAKSIFQKVLTLQSDHSEALNNLGIALKNTGKLPEAIEACEQALALESDNPSYHKNLAMTLLAAGRFETGWREYEWRWKTTEFADIWPDMSKPLWHGESGEGRILLIRAEQGFGDTLQFCRYVPLAAARDLRVILEVQPALVRLLESLAGSEQVIAQGQPLPNFDLYCPMMSLPLAFDTRLETIPAVVPYLSVNETSAAAWRDRLSDDSELKVGLAWAGRSRIGSPDLIAADCRRSIPPGLLAPLMGIDGIRFFSLQKVGPPVPKEFGLVDLMDTCRDFADTAALVANLDLVISVDTAIVHLAGALGKPVWVLDRFDSCWRWLKNREDSPWYPTLRLFRQSCSGDWTSVVSSVKIELQRLAAETN